jgi:hypothetical protein
MSLLYHCATTAGEKTFFVVVHLKELLQSSFQVAFLNNIEYSFSCKELMVLITSNKQKNIFCTQKPQLFCN